MNSATNLVCKSSMIRAAEEEKTVSIENKENGIVVSDDGLWRKRGFTSFYEITTKNCYFTELFFVNCYFTENLEEVAGVTEIKRTIEKLTDLEQKDRIKTQNQFLEEISSLTGKFSLSSNCTRCIS